jgi:CRISPR-associated protein (TIGR02584 family)
MPKQQDQEAVAKAANWDNVLIVTGGLTPQVVTETIYALATRSPGPFIPAKIVCVVTKTVADRFGGQFEAALARLKHEVSIEATWDRSSEDWRKAAIGLFVEYPRYPGGAAVEDIRSDDDAVRFANLVSEIIRVETAKAECRIHLSLAGGRKTMSFHGGAALSLFGRTQDELSHVLVNPQEFEGCADFWFPTKTSCPVKHRDGRALDAKDASVELANIPYIRARGRIPGLIDQALDYSQYVAQTNAALGRTPLFLELTTAEQRVRIGDILDFTLANTDFALYQLMAEWKRGGTSGAGPRGIGNGHSGWLTAHMFEYPEQYAPNPVERLIEIYDQTFKRGTKRPKKLPLTAKPRVESQRKANLRCLAQWKSRMIRELQERLHLSELADRFGAPFEDVEIRQTRTFESGPREVRIVVFGLRLLPSEIDIHAG